MRRSKDPVLRQHDSRARHPVLTELTRFLLGAVNVPFRRLYLHHRVWMVPEIRPNNGLPAPNLEVRKKQGTRGRLIVHSLGVSSRLEIRMLHVVFAIGSNIGSRLFAATDGLKARAFCQSRIAPKLPRHGVDCVANRLSDRPVRLIIRRTLEDPSLEANQGLA